MSEPTYDKIVWFADAPERSPITSFTTQELLEELKGRDGVTTHNEGMCYVEPGCQYQDYDDCAVCIKEHPVSVIVVRGKE